MCSSDLARYNTVIVDECVSNDLTELLVKQFTPAIILGVGLLPELKGLSDDALMSLGSYYDAVLITNDKGFFKRYSREKLYAMKLTERDCHDLIIDLSRKNSSFTFDDYIRANYEIYNEYIDLPLELYEGLMINL